MLHKIYFSELQESGYWTLSVQNHGPVVFGSLQYVKSVNIIYIKTTQVQRFTRVYIYALKQVFQDEFATQF